MVTSSSQVFCVKQINLQDAITSTKPHHYRFYGSHRSKVIVSKHIGKIHYLQCECQHFDFGQKLKTTFPYLGKADIRIEPFYEIPKLMDTELSIAANNVLGIKKNFQELSTLNQQYVIYIQHITFLSNQPHGLHALIGN